MSSLRHQMAFVRGILVGEKSNVPVGGRSTAQVCTLFYLIYTCIGVGCHTFDSPPTHRVLSTLPSPLLCCVFAHRAAHVLHTQSFILESNACPNALSKNFYLFGQCCTCLTRFMLCHLHVVFKTLWTKLCMSRESHLLTYFCSKISL